LSKCFLQYTIHFFFIFHPNGDIATNMRASGLYRPFWFLDNIG